MGTVHGKCDRPVNEGLWLAFVKTQWSSYMLKVRRSFWHEEMKTFYFLGNVMIWIKIVRLPVSSYHSAGVLYDLFKELSFSTPVMPPWLSGGEVPLLSPCNLSWVLPSTLHYSQPIAQIPMYLQTSRLRLQNNKNAAQVLLYALCKAGKGLCCVLLLAWAFHTHSSAWLQSWSNHWSKANMITVNHINYICYDNCTHEWSSTDASCRKLFWRKLFCTHTFSFFINVCFSETMPLKINQVRF